MPADPVEQQLLQRLIAREGGYQTSTDKPGGQTNAGITRAAGAGLLLGRSVGTLVDPSKSPRAQRLRTTLGLAGGLVGGGAAAYAPELMNLWNSRTQNK